MLRVLVCVSGGGTNLQALIDGVENGRIRNAEIVRVISNNRNAYALTRADEHGIEGICVSPGDFRDRAAFYDAFLQAVDEALPDLIVLAGFLVVIPVKMIEKYRNRILNIHPSLIPSFCGTGFYGLKVHEKALASESPGPLFILWMRAQIPAPSCCRKQSKLNRATHRRYCRDVLWKKPNGNSLRKRWICLRREAWLWKTAGQ